MPNHDIPEHLKPLAEQLSPKIPDQILASHLLYMEPDYFLEYNRDDIQKHLQAITNLSDNKTCSVRMSEDKTLVSVLVIGFDVPGVFAMITGLMTIFDLNILSGKAFSYHKPKEIKGKFQGMFVDRFTVECSSSRTAFATLQSNIHNELLKYHSALVNGSLLTTQESIHRRVGDYLSKQKRSSDNEKLLPVSVTSTVQSDRTILHIKGHSVKGFLFSLANALTIQGAIIHRLDISTEGHEADDLIAITDKRWRPYTRPEKIQQLKTAVVLIKQFTLLLPAAPNYDLAMKQFHKFLSQVFDKGLDCAALLAPGQNKVMSTMARAFGSGENMWEEFLRLQSDTLLPMLRQLDELKWPKNKSQLQSELTEQLEECHDYPSQIECLNRFKDKELLRTDLLYLIYPNKTFLQFGEELSFLAEVILNAGVHIIRNHLTATFGHPTIGEQLCKFGVFALGKFGGQEIGYASDLELVLIYDSNGETNGKKRQISNAEFFTKMVQQFSKVIRAKQEGIFELDLRLRPHGNDGPLANTLAYWEKYYEPGGKAHDFERQALIKLRPIYGDMIFTTKVMDARDKLIYGKQKVGVDQVLTLRRRQQKELLKPDVINTKYSPGGLCEIEYGVQFLQLAHGAENRSLRTPNTIQALERLLEKGLLTPGEFEKLYNCYAFHRRLINALRMVRGQAKDLTLPPKNSDAYLFLARRMGYLSKPDHPSTEQLATDILYVFRAVRLFFQHRFIHFKTTSFIEPGLPDILTQTGFGKVEARITQSMGLKNGQTGLSILRHLANRFEHTPTFIAILVSAQRFLKNAPSPDSALINFERFLSAPEFDNYLLQQMYSHPRYIEILILILGYGEALANILIRRPIFLQYITHHSSLKNEKSHEQFNAETLDIQSQDNEYADYYENLKIYNQRELLRIGIRDLVFRAPLIEVTREISMLAECIIHRTYHRLAADYDMVEMAHEQCILALGKLGGRELNYSSDIDIVFVCKDKLNENQLMKLEKLNRAVLTTLSKSTANSRLFRTDANLRPYGAQGLLTGRRSFYENYYKNTADGWELQSWLKARPIAGHRLLGERVAEYVRGILFSPIRRLDIQKSLFDIRIKTLEEQDSETLSRNVKNGVGGLRTIEFYTQAKQVEWGRLFPGLSTGNTLEALDILLQSDILQPEKQGKLVRYYKLLRRIEHALQLEGFQQRRLIPNKKSELTKLAKRLGYEPRLQESSADQLMNEYQQATKYLTPISEELFPGSSKFSG